MPVKRFKSNYRAKPLSTRVPSIIEVQQQEERRAATVVLSSSTWLGPVFYQSGADSDTTDLADLLIDHMNDIQTGAITAIASDPDTLGIYIGLHSDYASITTDVNTYDYAIFPDKRRIFITASSVKNLERAIYRFLEELGYRWYWPIEGWHITPVVNYFSMVTPIVSTKYLVNISGIGIGGGILAATQARLTTWETQNGIHQDEKFPLGHAWQSVISTNQATFNSNPEYSSNNQANGGSGSKLCVLESAVETMAIDWAKLQITSDTARRTVSMAAADGSAGWTFACNTNEQTNYNPSDRQILLANAVQEALDLDLVTYRNSRVVIQAYGETSVTPSESIDPRLITVVTDGYYFGGQTYDSVIADYQAQGAIDFWPYSYLSIITWSKDGPGQHKACNLAKLAQDAYRALTIGSYKGYSSEGSPSWAPCGMGYWILSHLLRDGTPSDTYNTLLDKAETLKEQYLQDLFGNAKQQIKSWYDLQYTNDVNAKFPLVSTDLIHRMYDYIQQALEQNITEAEKQRILDLGIYTQYCDRLQQFNADKSGATLEPVLELAYQTRNKDLVHFRTMYYDPTWTTYIDEISDDYGYEVFWNTVTDGHPWSDAYPTEEQINEWITTGLSTNTLLPFDVLSFNSGVDGSLYWPNASETGTRGAYIYHIRDSDWYLWLKSNQSSFAFTARAGIAFQNQGNAFIRVYDVLDSTLLGEAEIPNDNTVRSYEIEGLFPNTLYRVSIDCNGGVDPEWTTDYAMTRESGVDQSPFAGDYSGWFYVPPGTTTVGGFSQGHRLRIWNSSNTQVHQATEIGQYFSIATEGNTGYWRFDRANTVFQLLTIPNQTALSPAELLLPIGI